MGLLDKLRGTTKQEQPAQVAEIVQPALQEEPAPEVKKQEEVVAEPKKEMSEEDRKKAIENFANTLDKALNKKQFITVTSQYQLSGSEVNPAKTWRTLKTLFSEVPGAIQCATVIKNRIMGGGFVIKPADGSDQVDENDEEYIRLKDFIEEPNTDETLEDVFAGLIQNYLCYGIAYLEKVMELDSKTNKKMLTQVFLLDVEKMKILLDKEARDGGVDLVVGYSREINGSKKKIVYATDEVFRYRRPAPDGNIYGQATMESHTAVNSMAIQALTYNVNFLKNDGKQPLQIKLPDDTGRAEGEAFQTYYDKFYSGPSNAGRTLILYGGAEAKELGTSLKDMDYQGLIKTCKGLVAGMFGVPLVMISDPEGSNRASSIEERKGFHVNCTLPERRKLLKKFNKEIVKEGLGVTKYVYDIEELDVDDQGKLTTEANGALGSGMSSLNEACEYAGWEKVNEPWADQKIIINNGKAVLLDEEYFATQKKIAEQMAQPKPAPGGAPAPAGAKPAVKPGEKKPAPNQAAQQQERNRKTQNQPNAKKSVEEEIADLRTDISKHLYY